MLCVLSWLAPQLQAFVTHGLFLSDLPEGVAPHWGHLSSASLVTAELLVRVVDQLCVLTARGLVVRLQTVEVVLDLAIEGSAHFRDVFLVTQVLLAVGPIRRYQD